MKYNKYKIEEINIGDEIYFDSSSEQANYDSYWLVTGKDTKNVMVRLDDIYWTVLIDEVRQHKPSDKKQ
jgi:hypothetical protein